VDIQIGADVMGRDGKLGTVRRLVLTPRADRVVDLVIQQAGLLGGERIVPLSFVQGVEHGVVHLDLDGAGLKEMIEYSADAYRAPATDYIAPPAAETPGRSPMDFQMDRLVASGAIDYNTGKPGGYPGDEGYVSEDRQPPIIARGTDVFDVDGERVGDVGEFGIDPSTGRPTRLTVRHGGLIFKDEIELPLDAIRELGRDGIALAIRGDELDAIAKRDESAA
jgi:uncharacterized protein YrrD